MMPSVSSILAVNHHLVAAGSMDNIVYLSPPNKFFEERCVPEASSDQ